MDTEVLKAKVRTGTHTAAQRSTALSLCVLIDCGYMVGPDRIKPYKDVALDGGAVTCPSLHASDQIGIMVGDLADSATLGGAVALSTSGTRATSVHGNVKARTSYLPAYKQRWRTRSLTRQQ